eukprot:1694026-Rhodomonas_salina.2
MRGRQVMGSGEGRKARGARREPEPGRKVRGTSEEGEGSESERTVTNPALSDYKCSLSHCPGVTVTVTVRRTVGY